MTITKQLGFGKSKKFQGKRTRKRKSVLRCSTLRRQLPGFGAKARLLVGIKWDSWRQDRKKFKRIVIKQ